MFAWSTIPYRSEWKYDLSAHKKILIDIGHVSQNLYLASESINAGACAIGIYDQNLIDEVLGLDGDGEKFTDEQIVQITMLLLGAGVETTSHAIANTLYSLLYDPFSLDIHRSNNKKHLTFGNGPHFCLGTPLARSEIS